MLLQLIRHGQTPSNVLGLLDTDVPGPGLTPIGHAQAAALPSSFGRNTIEAVYASNLVRTQMTGLPLAASEGLPLLVRPGLREISAGRLEMRSDHDAVAEYLSTVIAWTTGDLERRLAGGERGLEVIERFDEVIAEIAAEGHQNVAVVSHGAMIRFWAGYRASNLNGDLVTHTGLDNTGIVALDGDPESGWRVLTWMGQPASPAATPPGQEGPAGETLPEADVND